MLPDVGVSPGKCRMGVHRRYRQTTAGEDPGNGLRHAYGGEKIARSVFLAPAPFSWSLVEFSRLVGIVVGDAARAELPPHKQPCSVQSRSYSSLVHTHERTH